MSRIFFLSVFLFIVKLSISQTSTGSGLWSVANWDVFPSTGDAVAMNHVMVINNDTTFDFASIALSADLTIYGDLYLTNGVQIAIHHNTLTVTGNIYLQSDASIVTNSNGVLSVGGNLDSNGNSLFLTNNNDITIAGDLIMEGASEYTNNGSSISVGNDFTLNTTSTSTSLNYGDLTVGRYFNLTQNGVTPGFVNTRDITAQVINVYDHTDVQNSKKVFASVNLFNGSTWNGNAPTGILPVEMVYFNAGLQDGHLTAVWATESETNCEKYIISVSADAKEYTPIAEVTGAGNTSSFTEYSSVLDYHSEPGIIYVRLQQIDFDGTIHDQGVVSVWYDAALFEFPSAVSRGQIVALPETAQHAQVLSITGYKTQAVSNGMVYTQNLSTGMYIYSDGQTQQVFSVK